MFLMCYLFFPYFTACKNRLFLRKETISYNFISSEPINLFKYLANRKKKSDNRLIYTIVSCGRASSPSRQMARSERRHTVRQTSAWAAGIVPPGRTKPQKRPSDVSTLSMSCSMASMVSAVGNPFGSLRSASAPLIVKMRR